MLALFAVGWATFALLYCAQPLLPVFAAAFHVSPTQASLTVSATTGMLALLVPFAGALSDIAGRKTLMTVALVFSSGLTIICAAAPNFPELLMGRCLVGIAIAAIPATAMAYLGEEIEPRSMGVATGLYIGGSALGGMSGRVLASSLTDALSWRWAIALVGIMGLGCAALLAASLPPSRRFTPQAFAPAAVLSAFGRHLADPALLYLFLLGFLLMGGFVTLYNYVAFRLVAPPYHLSQTEIGLLFTVYVLGVVSSTGAGGLADRFGRRRVLWVMVVVFLAGIWITLAHSVLWIVAGVGAATAGFFGAHSIASSWIGRRALSAKAQANALYLFFYYMGSSVVGSLGGVVWSHGGWRGVVLLLSVLQLGSLAIAFRMLLLPPLIPNTATTRL